MVERTEDIYLTKTEVQIIKLICRQMTNKQIAEKLGLQLRTIEDYRSKIVKKIGARNTAGIVIYAYKTGLVKF